MTNRWAGILDLKSMVRHLLRLIALHTSKCYRGYGKNISSTVILTKISHSAWSHACLDQSFALFISVGHLSGWRSHSTSFLHRSSCFQTPITTIHINRPSCAALSDTINKIQAINHAMGQRIPPTTPGLGDLTIRARFNRITAAISEKHVLHSVYKGYEVYILTNNYSMQSHARYDSHNRVCGLP